MTTSVPGSPGTSPKSGRSNKGSANGSAKGSRKNSKISSRKNSESGGGGLKINVESISNRNATNNIIQIGGFSEVAAHNTSDKKSMLQLATENRQVNRHIDVQQIKMAKCKNNNELLEVTYSPLTRNKTEGLRQDSLF